MKSPFKCLSLAVLFFQISTLYVHSQSTCQLTCNSLVNVSYPSNSCIKKLSPLDFLRNPDPNCTSYSLSLDYPFTTEVLDGQTINRSHLGHTFVYRVNNGNNNCWGYVKVEDKAPPLPFCKNRSISCFQFAQINDLTKKVLDNCSEDGQVIIEKLNWEDLGCTNSLVIGRAFRTILTIDKWGNSSRCNDTLTIKRDSFALIRCADMVRLECRMLCKKAGNTGSNNVKSNFDLITFSPTKGDPSYPTPELLLYLQTKDTFNTGNVKCLNPNLKSVPFIFDTIYKLVNGNYVVADTIVPMYPATGLMCKLLVTYTDAYFPICGSGFKIRREWRITDWCKQRDTTCVQYITVEDRTAPVVTTSFTVNNGFFAYTFPGYRVDAVTGPHDCFAHVCVDPVNTDDCSQVTQFYSLSYKDPYKPGSVKVYSGNPKECFDLPAIPNNSSIISDYSFIDQLKDFEMPRHCYIAKISTSDACYNSTSFSFKAKNLMNGKVEESDPRNEFSALALICVTDNTPPAPVCDEVTQTTIDPQTCWSRIYASDLDNGSRDNCCDVLHFAVAQMDTINYYRNLLASQLEIKCGKTDFWKYKADYDQFIEEWINCYVFKDYIDVTECNRQQLVLRVYEACGIPRLDDHVFACGPHAWFCYNTYFTYFLNHNYLFEYNKANLCSGTLPLFCRKELAKQIHDWVYDIKKLLQPKYTGALPIILNAVCLPSFIEMDIRDYSALPPGNTCSRRLYADCMIDLLVDDKTPPVAQKPADKFWYCDNVATSQENIYEYAQCDDNVWDDDNGIDGTCKDQYGNPYNEIESIIENDVDATDTINKIKKSFGWYGCHYDASAHPDEHGVLTPCAPGKDTWTPIYCRSWLILDARDQAGKVNPKELFDVPVLRSGNPGTERAGNGKFFIWDNCWIDTSSLTVKEDSYFDNCGNGWIKRSWTAKDKCGNSVSTDQKIVTKHRSDFEAEFPADKITTCGSNEALSPDAIGRPMIMDDECELVGVNYEDQKFDIVPDACFKIIRTWTVIDWCKYKPEDKNRGKDIIVDDRKVANPTDRSCVYRHMKDNGDGYMTYIQIIKVKDTIAPTISIQDTTVCIYDENCLLPSVVIPFKGSDNCSPTNLLSYRWEIDENPSESDLATKTYNSGSIDKKSAPNVNALSIIQRVKTSLVTVFVEDNCGNESSTTFKLTVKDCKKPTPYCFNGIATVIMPSTGTIKVWASDLNAGSYDNCTPKNKLKFSFTKDRKDSCRLFECKDIPNGIAFTNEVDIYVFDEEGNYDFCRTYVDIQDGAGDVCKNAKSLTGSIAGLIANIQNQPIASTIVSSKSSYHLPDFKTLNDGNYSFFNLPLNTNYEIKPSRNDLPTNGVTTIDLVKIQRHIIGIEPLTNPYDKIAADVNHDNDITALDLIELRKVILGIFDNFQSNTSWRFAPKSFTIQADRPFQFPELINVNTLQGDEINKDFVGIKIGDVNSSSVPNNLLGSEARGLTTNLMIKIDDHKVQTGQIFEIPFYANEFDHIRSLQFTLSHEGLDILDVKAGILAIDQRNIGLNHGDLTMSWNDPDGLTVPGDAKLFTIKVKAMKDVLLSQSLRIHSRITLAESYNGNEIMGVGLSISNPSGNSLEVASYKLYQNTPNPFNQLTQISFEVPKNLKVQFYITDIMGRKVYAIGIDAQKGYNSITINHDKLGASGVYYYTIESADIRLTKKLILSQ